MNNSNIIEKITMGASDDRSGCHTKNIDFMLQFPFASQQELKSRRSTGINSTTFMI